ncbi:MAG: outer membrane lipoprotein-sorting protein [Deltaproteobacteria bacterium]|nr:outer membrane lipoprotein-sorting protein [Deltaproteobacteria bacterium]
MNRIVLPPAILFLFVLLLPSGTWADDGRSANEIVDQMLSGDSMAFDQGYAVVQMTIENKRGKSRVRTVESKGKKSEGLRRFLITFLDDDVAGTQMLSLERKDGDDLQYLYLASMKETRKIAGADKNDNFMGTDFTFADMEQRDVDNADYERLADEEVSGIPAYHIVATPKAGTSSYAKLELWVDRKDHLPLKIYYYDLKGELLKKMISQKIEPRGGKPTITLLLMKNVQKGSRTTLKMLKLERGASIPDGIFNPDALGK